MNFKKTIVASSLVLSTVFMGSALAGIGYLELCSSHFPPPTKKSDQINVKCHGKNAPPIPYNSCASLKGITEMPWVGLWLYFGRSKAFDCTFTDGNSGQQLGTAHVKIGTYFNSGTLSHIQHVNAYDVDGNTTGSGKGTVIPNDGSISGETIDINIVKK